MTQVAWYKLSMYGIKLNDGTWMKCIDGKDWYSTEQIAREILPDVTAYDKTLSPPAPVNTPPSETAMQRYRSANARTIKAHRTNARHTAKYGSQF